MNYILWNSGGWAKKSVLEEITTELYFTRALSSAEAPVSKHQRKKKALERENGSAGNDGKCFNFSSSQPPRAAVIFFPRRDCRRPLRRRESLGERKTLTASIILQDDCIFYFLRTVLANLSVR